MTVTIDMSEYQDLKEKADRAERLEQEVSYWKGEYDSCNRSRLHEQDRTCALQMFLVDEMGYTFNEVWNIAEDIQRERKGESKKESEPDEDKQ